MSKYRDIRICFVGDSFVNGTGDETKLGWAGRLCAMSHTEVVDITYYNLGIRRNTSSDIRKRWEYECSSRLIPDAENIIIFSFGVNDTVIENNELRVTKLDSIDNVRSILLESSKKYIVKMIGPTPIDDEEQNVRIKNLDNAFLKVCNELSIPYLSVFEKLESESVWVKEVSSNDGAHPRSSGYAILANIVKKWSQWEL